MKKTFKIILGVFVAFFIIVAILLIVDISNDVEYKTFDKQVKTDSIYQRVTTEAKSERDLRTIVKEIKEENKDVDAVWLWIYEPRKNGKLLANARIPYNKKGQLMIGANSSDYIFEMANSSGEKENTATNKQRSQKEAVGSKDVEAFKNYAFNLKGSPFIKTISLIGDNGYIEYFGSYAEFKQAKPDTKITEDLYKSYFETEESIQKILVGENVRLLRQFPNLTATSMVLPYGGKTYTIDLTRKEVNDYLKFKVEELNTNDDSWINRFSDPYIYNAENRQKFFDKFVKTK